MKVINPTTEEAALLRSVLDPLDPPHDGIDVGTGTELLQHDTTWTRASGEIPGTTRPDGTIVAAGQTVKCTGFADEFSTVEYPTGLGDEVANMLESYPPGPERGLAVALAAKIRAASGGAVKKLSSKEGKSITLDS